MMEARLFCVEQTASLDDGYPKWQIANGNGVPISLAHVSSQPSSLLAAEANYNPIIVHMQEVLKRLRVKVNRPAGWSDW